MPEHAILPDAAHAGAAQLALSFILVGDGALLIECGERLLARCHRIAGVATAEPAIRSWAAAAGLPLCAGTAALPGFVTATGCDVLLSIYNRVMLPAQVLALPRRLSVNYHDGPLPEAAGFHVTCWALLEGKTEHAITWHAMTGEADAGPILLRETVPVAPADTAFTLNRKCHDAGLASFDRLLDLLACDPVPLRDQPRAGGRCFPRRRRPASAGFLAWDRPAAEACALVRATDFGPAANPFMTAKLLLPGAVIGVVRRAEPAEPAPGAIPGTVLATAVNKLRIATTDATLELADLVAVNGGPLDLPRLAPAGSVLPAVPAQLCRDLAGLLERAARAETYWCDLLRRWPGRRGPAVCGAQAGRLRLPIAGSPPLPPGFACPGDASFAVLAALLALDAGHGLVLGMTVKLDGALAEALLAAAVPLEAAFQPDDNFAVFAQRLAAARERAARRFTYVRDLVLRDPQLQLAGPPQISPVVHRLTTLDDALPDVPLIAIPDDGAEWLIVCEAGDSDPDKWQCLAERVRRFQDRIAAAPDRKLAEHYADLAALSDRQEREQALVARWRDVYQAAYAGANDGLASTACWRDSVAGVAIPAAEMQDWLDQIVAVLLARPPGRVLEIGCGTGLLLSRIAPHATSCLATDLTDAAIAALRGALPQAGLPPIDLLVQPADDFSNFGSDPFDTVIVNSVVQYFPSAFYLEHVLDGLLARLAPGGRIWIGDVRHPALLEAFHLDIIRARIAAGTLPPDQLRAAWQDRLAQESELAVAPGFFHAFSARDPSLVVWSELKRGGADNELIRFRYDVMLERRPVAPAIPITDTPIPDMPIPDMPIPDMPIPDMPIPDMPIPDMPVIAMDWRQAGPDLGALEQRLHAGPRVRVVLTEVPDRRTAGAVAAWQAMSAGVSVAGLAAAAAAANQAAIEPDALRALAAKLGWSVAVSPGAVRGCFDAALAPAGQALPLAPVSSAAELTNAPLGEAPYCSVAELVARQARVHPDRPAVASGGETLTYAELDRRVGSLSAALRSRGIGAGACVGVCLPRSVDLPVALLGILRAGATYVPLDPEFPPDRLAFMAEDAGICLVIGAWPGTSARAVPALDLATLAEPPEPPGATGAPGDLAYILYTSGSTGRPKGVQISCGALANLLASMRRAPGFDAGDRMLALTTIGFDISLLELCLPLVVGGTLDIVEPGIARDGLRLRAQLEASGATVIQATPATWHMLLAAEWRAAPGMRLLCGGERLSTELAERLLAGGAELWNLYGPTETTIWSTVARIRPGEEVTIGRPIAATICHVVSEDLAPLPDGCAGELLIGGAGLALGYRNLPDQTARAFVRGPDGARAYRTGDRVRRLPDGRLIHLGRLDAQLKLDGHRIEPGEIEAALLRAGPLQEAVAVLRQDEGAPAIIGFVLPRPGPLPEPGRLLDQVRAWLPAYMIPRRLHLLSSWPLTANGKIDRGRLAAAPLHEVLAAHAAALPDEASPIALRRLSDAVSEEAAALVDHAAEALAADVPLGQYGFNSIRFTALCVRLNKRFGSALTPALFYRHPTVHSIAQCLLAECLLAEGCRMPGEAARSAAVSPQARAPLAAEAPGDAVAIIGLAARLPGGDTAEAFWQALLAGEDPIRTLPETRRDATWRRVYGEAAVQAAFIDGVDLFDAAFFGISPREAEWMDPRQRLLLETTWELLENAGYAPASLAGTDVGVFVGASGNDWWELQRDRQDAVDAHTLGGFSGAILSNRLSFWFDLRGPSATVDTACSSSAVALHRAAAALARGDCAMAIAAGVNVIASPWFHRALEAGGYLSPAARCKVFEAGADGYVRGEGVAAVLLKPLARARADGDTIHAIIRGSAENHGGRANALSAPNQAAQAALIAAAIARAGIDPDSIGVIEAHGTGTSLGDPIEMNALREAFARLGADAGPPRCAIGALKAAVGHLEAAAGIAGLVKLILALRHHTLPGLPRLQQQNPYVDLANSRFRLLRRTESWAAPGDADGRALPRRAGLSSFGFGGANVHLVLEEAPVRQRIGTPAGPKLLLLSARSETALRHSAARLASWLSDPPAEVAIEDIAFTLQVGRAALPWRLALVVSDLQGAAALLGEHAAGRPAACCHHADSRRAAPALERIGDSGAGRAFLAHLVAHDPNEAARLWTLGAVFDWAAYWTGQPARVPLPTYPFERHRFWLPGPAATSAPPAPARVQVSLTGSDAVLGDHVVAGETILPAVALAELARAACEQVAGRTVHSLHNLVWMRPAKLTGPRLDLLTTVTVEAAGAKFATGGESGVLAQGRAGFEPAVLPPPLELDAIRARCRPGEDRAVLYARLWQYGLQLKAAYRPLQRLWIGAGEALAELALPDMTALPTDWRLHPALLDGALQTVLCGLWDLDARTLHLPFSIAELMVWAAPAPHCFAHVRPGASGDRFDIRIVDAQGRALLGIRDFYLRPLPVAAPSLHCFTEAWRAAPAPLSGQIRGPVLLVGGAAALQAGLRARLAPAETLDLPGSDRAAWQTALAGLRDAGRFPATILFWPGAATPPDTGWAAAAIGLVAAIARCRPPGVDTALFAMLTEGAGLAEIGPRAVSALLRSLAREQTRWVAKTIALPPDEAADAERVLAAVRAECAAGADAAETRHGPEGRAVRHFVPHVLTLPPPASEPASDSTSASGGEPAGIGAWWITGALGGLGRLLARHLAGRGGRLALSGRGPADRAFEAELIALGAEVIYLQVDLAEAGDCIRTAAAIRARFGAINGVYHLAGAIRDASLAAKDLDDVHVVLAPKIAGACHLDAALRDDKLEAFVLFSSVAGALGNAGQGDYALANRFLDGFAVWREAERAQGRRHGRTLALAWPLWRDGGMHAGPAAERLLANSFGLTPLETADGLAILEAALRGEAVNLLVMPGEAARIRRTLGLDGQPAQPSRSAVPADLLPRLVALAGRILKLTPAAIEPDADMMSYGFESLSFTEFANALNDELGDELGLDLTPALFFEHRSLTAVAAALAPRPVPPAVLPAPAPAAPVRPVGPEAVAPEPVAIVGLSCVLPDAADLEAFWDNLVANRDSVGETPPERWDWRAYDGDPREPGKGDCRWGAFIDGVDRFDARFFAISAREAALMDPQHRLFLQAAWAAIEDAAIRPSTLAGSSTGVFAGICTRDYAELMQQRGIGIEAHTATGNVPSILANRVSFQFDLRGPSEPVDTACSSALVAIVRAVEAIRAGSCTAALAGGVNLMLTPNFHLAFSKAGMLSPSGRCRSFDAAADGYVRGEGVGAVLLKPLSRALHDGDPIHAVIRSAVTAHGGHAASLTAPNPQAQAALLLRAYDGIDPSQISYIEAHGTGTRLGDPVEIDGLKQAFTALYRRTGQQMPVSPGCGLGSVKSNIGHLEAAAGIAGLAKLVLAMRHRMLPASLHVATPNTFIDLRGTPFEILRHNRVWPSGAAPRIAGVSSFGFGGVNAHVVLQEAPGTAASVPTAAPFAFVMSARSAGALQAGAGRLAAFVARHGDSLAAADVACTLAAGREPMPHRLAVVASGLATLRDRLEAFAAGATDGQIRHAVARDQGAAASGTDPDALAEAWVAGLAVPEAAVLRGMTGRRIHLPTYCFEPVRHWFATPDAAPAAAADPLPVFLAARAELETLCPLLLLRSLRGMGAFPAAGGAVDPAALRDRLGVHPTHHRLWEALIDMLLRAGTLRREAGGGVVGAFAPAELDGLDHRLNRLAPVAMHANLLRACLDRYGEVLRGELSASEVLFPGGTSRRVEMIYRGHAEAEFANHLVVEAVVQTVRKLLADGQDGIAVLEVGAGTGSTSAPVLAALAPFAGQVRFAFTDLSAAFTTAARDGLGAAYPFMHTALLDLERDPAEQGFAPASIDVVVAANVLHATRNIAATLGRLRTLLRPGGRLVLSELVRPLDFATLTFGLLPGWWLFDDAPRRLPHGPLLSPDGWRAALTEAGFADVHLPGERTDAAQLVLVASATGMAAASPARAAPPDHIPITLAELVALVADIVGLSPDDVDPDDGFATLGLDSILLTRLTRELESRFGPLSRSLVLEHPSIRRLAAHLGAEAMPPGEPVAPQPVAAGAVAVIGMAGRYPGAPTLEQFWANLLAGRRATGPVPATRWAAEDGARWGGFLEDIDSFDPLFFAITPADAASMPPEERLMLQTVWAALEDAGLTLSALAGRRVGVFVAASGAGMFAGSGEGMFAASGGGAEAPASVPASDGAACHIANRVSFFCNFTGPSLAVDTACSAALTAIHLACRSLKQGDCDVAVAAGVNLYAGPARFGRLRALHMLSSLPHPALFDRHGDGFIPGEGVGALLLRPLDAALAAGDPVHGVIRGTGIGHKGRNADYPMPSPLSQAAGLRRVLREAGVAPRSIGVVEAQATGAALPDSAEWGALAAVFREGNEDHGFCAYGSLKPNIGHLEAAAGMAQIAKVLLQFRHRLIAPSLFADPPDPGIVWDSSPFRPAMAVRPWTQDGPLRAVISSFGGGGAEAHLLVEAPPALPVEPVPDGARLVVLSARDHDRLLAAAERLAEFLGGAGAAARLADLAYTLQRGRHEFSERLAVVADSVAALGASLVLWCRSGAAPSVWSGRADRVARPAPDAVYAGPDLALAARLWVAGTALDWERLGPAAGARRIGLPTYPFAQRLCRAAPAPAGAVAEVVAGYYDALFADQAATWTERHLTFAPLAHRPPGFSWLAAFHLPEQCPEHAALLDAAQREAKDLLYRQVDFARVRRVLDIGCGLGSDLMALARNWPELRGQGYTLAPAQAEAARRRIRRAGLADRLSVTCADSTRIAHDAPYDLVIGFEVLPHISDKRAAFAAIAGCMAADGWLLLADALASTVTGINLPERAMFTSTAAEYAELLSASGLLLTSCTDVSEGVATFLHDPDFEANLQRVAAAVPATQTFEATHRGWLSFGQGLRHGLFRYVLLVIRPAPPGLDRAALLRANQQGLAGAEPDEDDLDTLDEAELDAMLDRLLTSGAGH